MSEGFFNQGRNILHNCQNHSEDLFIWMTYMTYMMFHLPDFVNHFLEADVADDLTSPVMLRCAYIQSA